jgi:ABC-type dipeptide/oligopeptide/nickel transport system permease component
VPVKDIILDRLTNAGLLAFVSFLLIVPLSMAFGVAAGMPAR